MDTNILVKEDQQQSASNLRQHDCLEWPNSVPHVVDIDGSDDEAVIEWAQNMNKPEIQFDWIPGKYRFDEESWAAETNM